MGTLAFFPWLRIREPLRIDRFHLECFRKGRAPAREDAKEQELIDAVLSPYRVFDAPVKEATIVRIDRKAYTADLVEAERNELFVFSQLVTMGGLAARSFFDKGYCNSVDFSFVIQGFREKPNGTFFDVRRRDGVTPVRVTADSYQVMAPPHLSHDKPVHVDVSLIEALVQARGHPLWDRIYESIGPFIRANTDSAETAEQSEVVEMVGAFEQALDVRGSDDLRREFEAHFRPTKDINPRNAPRIPPARRNGPSVRRLWMADFYDLRNAHAHGSQELPNDLIWDRVEHLLLGAYAYPLLVKSLLNEEGLYTLTDDDQTAIDLFEWRARTADPLLKRDEEHKAIWNNIKMDYVLERARETLERAALDSQQREEG